MLKKQSTYQSKVFRDFKTLDKRNYHAVVRFYERHQKEIPALDFDEAFVLQLHYCNALFEVGHYEKQIQMSDVVIECSILENIQYYQGEDVYLKTLFQKAKSLYHLEQYDQSEHILKELIKLSPNHKSYPKLLKRCFTKSSPAYIQTLQAIGIFMALIAVGLLVMNVLLVKNFYPAYSPLVHTIWISGVGLGVLLVFIGWVAKRISIQLRIKAFQEASRANRK